MRRVLARIVGTRPELRLRDRWWHRLVQVVFTCSIGALIYLGWPNSKLISPQDVSPENRVEVSNLFDFTTRFSGGGNPAVAFNASEGGWLVATGSDGQDHFYDWIIGIDHNRFQCKRGGGLMGASSDTMQSGDYVATQAGNVTVVPFMNHQGEKPGIASSVCWGPDYLAPTLATADIRYVHPSMAAKTLFLAKESLLLVVKIGMLALLASVLYYRLILYIIFGRVKK